MFVVHDTYIIGDKYYWVKSCGRWRDRVNCHWNMSLRAVLQIFHSCQPTHDDVPKLEGMTSTSVHGTFGSNGCLVTSHPLSGTSSCTLWNTGLIWRYILSMKALLKFCFIELESLNHLFCRKARLSDLTECYILFCKFDRMNA